MRQETSEKQNLRKLRPRMRCRPFASPCSRRPRGGEDRPAGGREQWPPAPAASHLVVRGPLDHLQDRSIHVGQRDDLTRQHRFKRPDSTSSSMPKSSSMVLMVLGDLHIHRDDQPIVRLQLDGLREAVDCSWERWQCHVRRAGHSLPACLNKNQLCKWNN